MQTRRQREDRKKAKEKRASRVPLGDFRKKLTLGDYKIPPDKVGRWINDDPGRLTAAKESGWAHLEDDTIAVGEDPAEGRDLLSMKVRRRVGTHEGGTIKYAYLMVIDKDLYDEDQQAKEDDLRLTDEAIYKGELGSMEGGGRYIPSGGINIKSD